MHMQRYSSAAIMNLHRNFLARQTPMKTKMVNPFMESKNACDVFINHRGIDTKRTIATLLYDHLSWLNLQPFLDNKNMKPGDKLFDNIDNATRNCKIGVTVFSPNYCKSYFCLHELALFMESKKKVIPIFCDIKPSELRIVNNGKNLSDVVKNASEIVIESLIEMESEQKLIKSSRNTPMAL
ncbi:hypothetical protein GOBAR_AA10725 [Gossypium barbadense]|uniref:TIR domain-containing protein n=1 Tax=Gossypium barbadense TaxID=3634 RepID=A0A2P5Y2W1_GOSBA|nr:hypothetical protein GOBAR_AA10725 [Gossypium barbadense]